MAALNKENLAFVVHVGVRFREKARGGEPMAMATIMQLFHGVTNLDRTAPRCSSAREKTGGKFVQSGGRPDQRNNDEFKRMNNPEMRSHSSGFFFLIPPSTILYSNSRHSSAPLKSGVRFDAARRMSLGRRMSALRI